ncbi:hypothetical protein [Flavobacterium psychrophilum]|uniref:hypothetical protein n=1 Tax=Flavobacterium psychrophilum TaxID=96345 RepID=UPI00117A86D9|nr:hypothetical protein [Flavobacterium psychrophilum]
MEKGKLKKQNKRIFYYLAIVSILILSSCSSKINQHFIKETLGLNIRLKEKALSWHEDYTTQGEGFSMDVYSFENDKDLNGLAPLNQGYPISYELRKDWNISTWSNTPFDNEDVLDLLLNYKIDNKEVKLEINRIEKIIKTQNNYISYYYKENKGYIYSVDLYILDMEHKKLYICEIIT